MRFRQQQEQARAATRALVLLFALTVFLTVVGVNGALALAWRLQFGGLAPYPSWFFETNTAVTLGFVLGGAWLESLQLRDGGAHVARMVGGREIVAPQSMGERRLRNVVDEMAIASGLKSPRIFVLDREESINALAAGWEQQDSVIAVTRGTLERLDRDELQGVVAHEFAHILNGDTRLNMRLIGMVFGLQMVFTLGRSLMSQEGDRRGRRATVLAGLALVVAGSIGWLAGRLLKAGVSRQREHLADASAVQFTRLPAGIGNALRKVAAQLHRGQRMDHVNAEVVSHLLLASGGLVPPAWFATHPPIAERLRRIFGHDMPPLADDPLPLPAATARELPALHFSGGARAADADPGAPLPLEAVAAAAADDGVLLELSGATMPEAVRAAVLACLVPPDAAGTAELEAWRAAVDEPAAYQRLLAAVQALPRRRRLPWFERLLARAAALPREHRAALLRDARTLVQADGRVSLTEYLQARVLRRQLAGGREHLGNEPRHRTPAQLAGPITTVSLTLATLLPRHDALPWTQAVLQGLGLPAAERAALPVAAEVDGALQRLLLLGRMHRPALAKQWLAAAGAPPPPPDLADALRCLCLLIDTPLPPQLAACFDPLPEAAEDRS